MNNIIDVDEVVCGISNVISLPEVYLKIRELMDDPDSNLDDFVVVVNTDSGLIVAVLKIVNSAFFGFPGQIDNINRALNLIGIGPLHDLVLSLSAVDALDFPNDIETLQMFWKRSIYCGVFSRLLAEKLNVKDAESLFIVGLLHEIGRLILCVKFPEQYQTLVNKAQLDNHLLIEEEQNFFATDYGKVGKALMAEWNLPIKFQYITEHHVEPTQATEFIVETSIVYIAHQLASNQFPCVDNAEYLIDKAILHTLNTTEDELSDLYEQANIISSEMESLILG